MPNCPKSPSGEHEYDLNEYSRDDQGIYVDCIHCEKTHFVRCESQESLFEVFGLNDDD